ncbi:hypothetical protein [Aeromonas salmonicida]|uniref:hypothetical protein n=1 Tax=Aeromonas salmonicida TaxID=645 RepID=UPI00232FCB67|nr:hypothetical protein [Aeromonas salmonicida]WCH25186.1 hypothetical protein ONZ54_22700 [Aeromonas salmonicida]
MTENTTITHDDIPHAMQALGIVKTKDFAKNLGITPRSLSSGTDEPMAIWRQMSIECLLRRENKWELFCQLRGDPVPSKKRKAPLTGERCVICHNCLEVLQSNQPDEPKGC